MNLPRHILTRTLTSWRPNIIGALKLPIYSPQLLHFSSLRHFHKHLVCNGYETRHAFGQSGSYPKPSVVKWKKELCNFVQFIGFVGYPVELIHLKSGKVLSSTHLGVKLAPTNFIWVELKFWGELAHIAHQHLQKGNWIYVSGRLMVRNVATEDEKQQTYSKVFVRELNFVEEISPSLVSVNEESYSSMAPAAKFSNLSKLSTLELWRDFFANPTEWWDNRKNKKHPNSPDFKHKDTGEALWLDGAYNLPWVKSQLEILDSRMQSHQKQD